MKVVILAAGLGKRFKGLDLPKPLSLLNTGQSILGLQLERFATYGLLDNVIVIVGHKKEKVMEQFPNLLYLYNPNFAQENTAKSLLRALYKIDEDLIWLNGDVVFHPKVLESIMVAEASSMIVNKAQVGLEEMKYCTNKGKIIKLSKNVETPEGEALGINFFKAEDLTLFKKNLEQCSEQDYFEHGIELSIEEGVNITPLYIPNEYCVEVDFPEDLSKANQLINSWNHL